ncbi:MAG TPA: sigma-54 factor interaction domain-containing protein [Blattabacteriaceae bacterium]
MANNNESLKALASQAKLDPAFRKMLIESGNESLVRDLDEVSDKTNTEVWLNKFITNNSKMIELKEHVRKLAPLNDPILIFGETGTGKELLAHALHGERKGKFIAINCAGLPEHLVESELFGHDKNSFTGALKDKTGLMEEAQDGTIFLDEIGDLAMPMQAKLLRAIQEKKIRKVGSNEERLINCRVVSATHRDLEFWVQLDKFREDLFYRISTFILKPSSLKQRSGDISKIIESLDKEEQEIEDYEEFSSLIDPSKLSGNVRSLQQIYRRYIILGTKPHE